MKLVDEHQGNGIVWVKDPIKDLVGGKNSFALGCGCKYGTYTCCFKGGTLSKPKAR
jgi:hypothetical protein